MKQVAANPRTLHAGLTFLLAASILGAGALPVACNRNPHKPNAEQPAEVPKTPALRLYVVSTVGAALEPCGCVKDMLGGIDHTAALVKSGEQEAPNSLVLAAGPMFFGAPILEAKRRTQDEWKAESLAASLADVGLRAWVPGANDFAAGSETLNRLVQQSQARVMASNLKVPGLPMHSAWVTEAGKVRVGIAGISEPEHQGKFPPGVEVEDAEASLRAAIQELEQNNAQVKVALVAMDRGKALRIAERVQGLDVMVVGKASDAGESNDAPTPPVILGKTLVVQGPNHLQGVITVDLFVRGNSWDFADGSGVSSAEHKTSLEARIKELSSRLTEWRKTRGLSDVDIQARERDLSKLRAELAQLQTPRVPKEGSFFRYELREVREKLGSDQAVAQRLLGYYKRVNEHNREAFKDRMPPPLEKGQPGYVGAENCKSCHEEAFAFWKGTKHASAYETLEVEFKEFNLDCVSCHVTGYEKPGGSTVTFVENRKDVQCEECHGPGSIHAKTESIDAIVLTPPKDLCRKCHHEPHVKADWDIEEAWKRTLGKGHGY